MATARKTRPPVGTLAWRLDWILRNAPKKDGRQWSMGALSLAAGLSRGHVEQIINGHQKSASIETIESLARAAGVRSAWLSVDEGDPFDEPDEDRRDLVFPDVYPSREMAILLVGGRVKPEVVRAVRSIRLEHDGDPGQDYWLRQLKDQAKKLMTFEAELQDEDSIEVQAEPGDRMPPM